MEKKQLKIIIAVLLTALILAVILGLVFGLKNSNDDNQAKKDGDSDESTDGDKAYFKNGAVATDVPLCSEIGRDVLKEGGHAVDAAIAALFCTGVINMHSSGIGGGAFFNVYDRKQKKAIFYDAREVGPQALYPTIYDPDKNLKNRGGLAVGVPGAVRGMIQIHKKYGKIKWERLITPSIEIAEQGFPMTSHMYRKTLLASVGQYVKADPGLSEIIVKSDGTMKTMGETVIDKKLSETLRVLRGEPDAINDGSLSQQFVDDVTNNGGKMTLDDLKNYKVKERPIIEYRLDNQRTVHSTSLPSGGLLLTSILKILRGYYFNKHDLETFEKKLLTYHRMAEGFKFSYAIRPHLGDPSKVAPMNKTSFDEKIADITNSASTEAKRLRINDIMTQPKSYYDDFFTKNEDGGTTHVSVVDKDGNAVSTTSTINYSFGAKIRSMKSGIIFNNEMNDFFSNATYGEKYPDPVYNRPGPGKRPLSSMCPTIVTNNTGDVVLAIGASGGLRITLSTAWVLMKKLWFDYSLKDAVKDVRVQEYFSSAIVSEKQEGFELPDDIRAGLEAKGHKVTDSTSDAIVQAVYVNGGKIYAESDPRKQGKAAGY